MREGRPAARPSRRCHGSACALAVLLGASMPAPAAVNDIFPGDYYPLKPEATSVTLYAFDRAQEGPYAGGSKLLDGELDSRISTLRIAHSVSIGGITTAGVIVLPWLRNEASPAPLARALGGDATGFSDLRAGVVAWLVNDPARASYLGVNAMIVAPTGSYASGRLLSPGENRWKFILSGGWQKDITPRLLVELAPEAAFYGDNADYAGGRRLAQRPSYALTAYLRWRASPAWHVHVGGQVNHGGETRIDGVDQRNPANNRRATLGVTWLLPEQQQLILRAARDTAIDNGFRTDREIALRYQKTF